MSIDLVRPAAVAGQFYPTDAAELRLQVTDFLDRAPDTDIYVPILAAAARNHRFSPIDTSELKRLDVEISVTGPLRPLANPAAIEIGLHGLFVRKGPQSGVLLPSVAPDQRWDGIEFLRQTCEKARLSPEAWQDSRTEVFTFTADVFPA